MKKKIMLWVTVLCLVFLMTGCGKKIKVEGEMKEDLKNSSLFYMVEGSEISDLTVIKRLTDEKNKTDKVYVAVTIDHPAATATRAYIMNYTCYNDGWHMDNVEEYYGDEIEWTTIPKNVPTNEEIMEQLIERSNDQIKAAYEEQYMSEELKNTYFFEEGKYATSIYKGDEIFDLEYECIAETKRVFEYVDVFQKQILYFTFDTYSYEWNLSYDETLSSMGYWRVLGEWKTQDNGITLKFDDVKQGYMSGTCIDNKNNNTEFWIDVGWPMSQEICDYYWTKIGNLQIIVTSNGIKCWDDEKHVNSKLEPVNLNIDEITKHIPMDFSLEVTGIIDKTTYPMYQEYTVIAEDVINWIFEEENLEKVEDIIHPYIKENNEDYWNKRKQEFQGNIEEYDFGSKLNYGFVNVYDEVPEEFKEKICDTEEIIHASYEVEYIKNGEHDYEQVELYMAKQNNQIYVISLDHLFY